MKRDHAANVRAYLAEWSTSSSRWGGTAPGAACPPTSTCAAPTLFGGDPKPPFSPAGFEGCAGLGGLAGCEEPPSTFVVPCLPPWAAAVCWPCAEGAGW